VVVVKKLSVSPRYHAERGNEVNLTTLASVGCVPRTILKRRSNSPEMAKRAELRKVRGTYPIKFDELIVT